MYISKINTVQKHPNSNYKKENNNINFGKIYFNRNTRFYAERIKIDLIRFLRYTFPDVILNIDNNITRNNMLYNACSKLESEIKAGLHEEKEIPAILRRIAELINPKNKAHELILKDNRFSIEDFEDVCGLLKEKENITLTENLLNLRNVKNEKLNLSKKLKGILELNKFQKLSRNYEKFKSYITLYIDDEHFIENLKKELDAETLSFDYHQLDKYLYVKKQKTLSYVFSQIPDETLMNADIQAINVFTDGKSLAQIINFAKGIDGNKFFEYFLSTSNSTNIELRIDFLKRNLTHTQIMPPLEDIQVLFERMDKDKNIQTIIYAYSNSHIGTEISAKKLLFYIDKFGSETIAENIDNFISILRHSRYEEPDIVVDTISNNLRNKYYKNNFDTEQNLHRISIGRIIRRIRENLSSQAKPVEKLNDIKFEDYVIGTPKKTDIESSSQVKSELQLLPVPKKAKLPPYANLVKRIYLLTNKLGITTNSETGEIIYLPARTYSSMINDIGDISMVSLPSLSELLKKITGLRPLDFSLYLQQPKLLTAPKGPIKQAKTKSSPSIIPYIKKLIELSYSEDLPVNVEKMQSTTHFNNLLDISKPQKPMHFDNLSYDTSSQNFINNILPIPTPKKTDAYAYIPKTPKQEPFSIVSNIEKENIEKTQQDLHIKDLLDILKPQKPMHFDNLSYDTSSQITINNLFNIPKPKQIKAKPNIPTQKYGSKGYNGKTQKLKLNAYENNKKRIPQNPERKRTKKQRNVYY